MSGSSSSNRADTAVLGGLLPFSTIDYPGSLAAVVYFKGCPWRCRYCQNTHLQARQPSLQDPSWDNIEAFLDARRELLDAVVFSGGEPLASSLLAELAGRVRSMGFKVGLHSAGAYPERLRPMLPRLDWIGLDIKAPFDDYLRITRTLSSGHTARQSLELLLQSSTPFECRTTIHSALHDEDSLLRLAHQLAGMGVKNYALQRFRAQGCADLDLLRTMRDDHPSPALLAELQRLFPRFELRTTTSA